MIINTSDQTFSGTTTYPWQPTTGETEAKIYHGNILTPTGVIALPSVPPGSNGTEVKKDLPGQLQRNLLSGAIPSDVRMTYEMRMGSSMNPITGQYVLNCLYPVTWVGLYNASNPIPTLPDPRAKVIMYTEAELPDNFGGAVTVDIDGDYVITPP